MSFPDAELDELATAALDGAATPAERARVEADPLLAARVESFRAIRARLADGPPVSGELRDRHVLAALALFDEQTVGSGPTADVVPATSALPAGVRSLSEARARRTRRLAPVLSIAAASVLVLGAGILVAGRGDDGGGADSASRAADTSLAADAEPELKQAPRPTSPAATAAPAMTAAPDATVPSIVIASVSTEDGVTAMDESVAAGSPVADSPADLSALLATVAAERNDGDALPASAGPCAEQAGTFVSDLLWQGQPAVLYAVPDLAAPTDVVVLAAETCEFLASAPAAG